MHISCSHRIDAELELKCNCRMSSAEVIGRLTKRLYGTPIIRNDVRGELVEEIVAMALEPEWQACGGDWASCDLKRVSDGLRLQVKQSAALQSWTIPEGPKPKPCFSIKSKKYRWEGPLRFDDAGRQADIFIFAWHDRIDGSADHRDPDQWQFFVVAERDLPDQKTISLSVLCKLAQSISVDALADEVRALADRLTA
jgi:hypothetical protein